MAASTRVAPSTPEASLRMRRVRQKNTSAESAIRSELHALGLRYRIQVPVLTKPRRVADVAFVGPRVAVFVDGCFWHGCPQHATWPKQNAEFWRAKILANQERDRDTDARLRAYGWEVVRVWAHERPHEAALRIAQVVRRRNAKGHA
ncbi:very short patch repair endonuclease [Sorangium sp. So ce145]|uniref:very short patch repair endonuclease n=1 Tax=Sorangium sp. So ce145 TaxID=3133285 RepID=UPI003F5E6791